MTTTYRFVSNHTNTKYDMTPWGTTWSGSTQPIVTTTIAYENKNKNEAATTTVATDPTMEIQMYTCPDDDTMICLPKTKELPNVLKWFEECGIVYEIDDDPSHSFTIQQNQYKTLSSYFGKKFEMNHLDDMKKTMQILQELVAMQEKLQQLAPLSIFSQDEQKNIMMMTKMMPTISFFKDQVWNSAERLGRVDMPACFQKYAGVTNIIHDISDKRIPPSVETIEKGFVEARILDVFGDKVSNHVLSNLTLPFPFPHYKTTKFMQTDHQNTTKDDAAKEKGEKNKEPPLTQLRKDPPLTAAESMDTANVRPYNPSIFFKPNCFPTSYTSYNEIIEQTEWENTPVYVVAVFLHSTELSTFVRVVQTCNKHILRKYNLTELQELEHMEETMKQNPFYGFGTLFVLKTTSKDIVEHIRLSFQSKQFRSLDEINMVLKIEENYIQFVQNNQAVGLDEEKEAEEQNVKRYLHSYFEIDNNPDHKYKAQVLFQFFANQKDAGFSVDTNFRNRLSKYLINMGLQKKRFSDGYYYYGLVKRENPVDFETTPPLPLPLPTFLLPKQ